MNELSKVPVFPAWRSMIGNLWNSDGWLSDELLGMSALPAVNMRETKETYELELAAPGFDKKDFELDLAEDVLTVSAARNREDVARDEEYIRREFSSQYFKRRFTLPRQASADIKAAYRNGILFITVKKSNDSRGSSTKISID